MLKRLQKFATQASVPPMQGFGVAGSVVKAIATQQSGHSLLLGVIMIDVVRMLESKYLRFENLCKFLIEKEIRLFFS